MQARQLRRSTFGELSGELNSSATAGGGRLGEGERTTRNTSPRSKPASPVTPASTSDQPVRSCSGARSLTAAARVGPQGLWCGLLDPLGNGRTRFERCSFSHPLARGCDPHPHPPKAGEDHGSERDGGGRVQASWSRYDSVRSEASITPEACCCGQAGAVADVLTRVC
jgi:hypothetical protein